MKNFLLVDDHVVVRSAIKSILEEVFKSSEISEAGNGDELVELLKRKKFDLVIMDIQMPKTDALGMMEYMNIKHPGIKVLIFSMSPEKIFAKRFLKAGAKGFVSKEATLEEVKKAINTVLNDRTYISDELAGALIADSYTDKQLNPFENLSSREFEIASLLLAGHTLSDIARSINLQVSTVGTHKARLFSKLKIENILELKEIARTYQM